jgi:hypothetical protein
MSHGKGNARVTTIFLRHFQGVFYWVANQGLKPLAKSYCPFGAEDGQPTALTVLSFGQPAIGGGHLKNSRLETEPA